MLRVYLGGMPSLPRARCCPSPQRVLALALGRNPQKRPHHAQPCWDQRPVFDFPTLETHHNCPARFVAARHGAPLRSHRAHTRGAAYTAPRPRTRVGTGGLPRAPFPPPLELCRAAGHSPGLARLRSPPPRAARVLRGPHRGRGAPRGRRRAARRCREAERHLAPATGTGHGAAAARRGAEGPRSPRQAPFPVPPQRRGGRGGGSARHPGEPLRSLSFICPGGY